MSPNIRNNLPCAWAPSVWCLLRCHGNRRLMLAISCPVCRDWRFVTLPLYAHTNAISVWHLEAAAFVLPPTLSACSFPYFPPVLKMCDTVIHAQPDNCCITSYKTMMAVLHCNAQTRIKPCRGTCQFKVHIMQATSFFDIWWSVSLFSLQPLNHWQFALKGFIISHSKVAFSDWLLGFHLAEKPRIKAKISR